MESCPIVQPIYCFSYIRYFKHLLENTMDDNTFNSMIEIKEVPKTLRIKTDTIYQYKLLDELDTHMTLIKFVSCKSSIIECLKKQFGTIAQIYMPKNLIQGNPEMKDFENWININTTHGFLSRFKFSSIIPYIFLDIKYNDRILSCGCNDSQICEIITNILKEGCIFINDSDTKSAKENYIYNNNNYCVISYPVLDIPNIIKYDKILCIAPSTEDGLILNGSRQNTEFTLDKAIENHVEQKKYLISALEKVKPGGIVVYSTFSLNPFENEAVINSVLKMKQFCNKCELVDCSSMFQEIKRSKGLNSWDLNFIPKNITDPELLESLSSNSIIKNIDLCMRFYPFQINCCGVFVAVIRKIKKISKKVNIPNPIENVPDLKFSVAQDEMIQTIINSFGLPEECNDILFVLKEHNKKKELYQLNTPLFDILTNFGFDKLRICHIGCLGFSKINEECDVPFIPSIPTLPSCAITPSKCVVHIDLNDFKTIIDFGQIQINQLSMKNQLALTANQTGGVYLILNNGYGPLIGGYLNAEYLQVFERRDYLHKLFKVVKEINPQKKIQKKISYFLHRIDENESKTETLEKKVESISNELKDLYKIALNNQIPQNISNERNFLIAEIKISNGVPNVVFEDFDFSKWWHYKLEFDFLETSVQGTQLRMQYGYKINNNIIWENKVQEYFYSTADFAGSASRYIAYTSTYGYFGFGNDEKFYRNNGGYIHGNIEFWNDGNVKHRVYAKASTTSFRIADNIPAATGGIYNFIYNNTGSRVVNAFRIMPADGIFTMGRFAFYGIH